MTQAPYPSWDPLASLKTSQEARTWAQQRLYLGPACDSDEWFAYQHLSTLDPTNFYMFSTHESIYGNNLHMTSKDPTTQSYFPHMEREALRSQGLNSKSSLQGKASTFKGSWSALHHYISTKPPLP